MIFLLAILASASVATAQVSDSASSDSSNPILSQTERPSTEPAGDADASEPRRPLESRYPPSEPEKKSWYNSDYIFGMTRGVADSTIAPAGKAPLFVLTVPLDIITLPFTLIGGFFG